MITKPREPDILELVDIIIYINYVNSDNKTVTESLLIGPKNGGIGGAINFLKRFQKEENE